MTDVGVELGWASPNLARFKETNSTISLDNGQISWVASINKVGGVTGAFMGSSSVAYLGSKNTILVTLILMCLKWLCLTITYIVNSVIWLYIFRFVGGITSSMAYCSFSLYLSEVTEPAIRGTLISISVSGLNFGILFSTIIESYVDIKVSIPIYLIICLIGIALFLYLPDSPYYCISNCNIAKAEQSIAQYFSDSSIREKMNEIKDFVNVNSGIGLKSKILIMLKPEMKKSIVLIILLFALPMMCGSVVLLYYMQIIITDSKSHLISPKNLVICIMIICIITGASSVKLMDRIGRKILLISSSTGVAAALIGLGLYFYLMNDDNAENLQWSPIVCICLFHATFVLGLKPVPHAVLSEIFPSSIKSMMPCVANLTASSFGFISVKSYQPMLDFMGYANLFLIYAGFSLLLVPTAIYLLPETKGKSLVQIQNDILSKSNKISL